ncbi:cysteine dioxygenase family protein [Burkholderia ubonensis]|uniref:Cysteine dioxygenase n=1 Tax=Burkholderia ubonensis subsp. mesacidophila TaxID=265293 RepID=A0A2A4F7D0_9BURK|nr:cysteine dioxygenase family protein [Burkholderia ubonensis]PCE28508.1 cysteine dioxygenase [Burkholderia ubonensis subsp. mesacidophila]
MSPSAVLSAGARHRAAPGVTQGAPADASVCANPLRPALARLCRQIDAAFDAALAAAAAGASTDPARHANFARSVRAALAEAGAAAPWLTGAERACDPQKYCRHLLAADPSGRYAIVSLVWRPGQMSPVHGHRTWCGYTVLDGTLTETLYDWDEATGLATDARRHAREAGAVSFVRAGAHGIHQLGHAGAAGDAPAVSLHVYGVPGEQIATHVNDLVRVATPLHA